MEVKEKVSHKGEGPGRPRKDSADKTKYHTKTIYFPSATNYDIAWKAFEKLCQMNKKPFLYNRNIFFKKGVIIRRLVLNYVLSNIADENIKDIFKDIILAENKDRVAKWEKDTGKTYMPGQ